MEHADLTNAFVTEDGWDKDVASVSFENNLFKWIYHIFVLVGVNAYYLFTYYT